MRTTLTWAICAALLGSIAGVALGYWEARPWALGAASGPAAKADANPAKPVAAPKAEIVETTFNFDKMESGTTQRREFPVKNAGKAPLSIEFVSHTCKCTTVELNGNKVEPGASAVVPPGDAAVVLLEWAAKVPAGPFRHGATFTTNDPAQSRLELQVEGEIVESTTLYPAQLDFASVRVGQPGEAIMFVTSALEPDVQILSHEVTDEKLAEGVSIKVEPAKSEELPPGAKAGAKIVATFNPGGAIGPIGGSLELTTNLKNAANLVVPIYGNVRGDISIFGKGWTEANGILRMGPATTADGGSTRLNVAVRGEHAKDTKLTVARVDPPELKATLGEMKRISDNLVQAQLTVEIPPGTRPMVRAGEDQGGEGEIILATTHPDTPEVRLRVTFTVKP
ncbi:MAG: DUF1573 domain-containing protein [Pirellulales bacterium]|nr:DUF1573 domain-containing protein [Pirellulales bacterium]